MHASGQITSNFLTQVNWMLSERRRPPTSLCTTSNFLMVMLVIAVVVVINRTDRTEKADI